MKEKSALEAAHAMGITLTFDDVLVRNGFSDFSYDKIDVSSRFSRNVPLLIPIASSPMDTVTEQELAIEMARLGGIGVIHRNLGIEDQVAQVHKVKYSLNKLIATPKTASEDETIEQILNRKKEEGYEFDTFPIIGLDGKLAGLLTAKEFEFCPDKNRLAREVMAKRDRVITASPGISAEDAYKLMQREMVRALPLVNENEELEGLYVFTDLDDLFKGKREFYNIDERTGQLRVGAAIGDFSDPVERERLEKLVRANVDVIIIDKAHGSCRSVVDTLKEIKEKYSVDVVVGNISNETQVEELLIAGADGLRVGQGPGGICTTRIITGTGGAQVSAIYKVARAVSQYASKAGKDYVLPPICGDGGLRYSGDITKAICAGAHNVMMGGMLAGTEEAPGSVVRVKGEAFKDYRGMGSIGAMRSRGGRQRYNQEEVDEEDLIAEGVEGRVRYKGRLSKAAGQYIGGLMHGMFNAGARTIEELREKEFDRLTPAGRDESHPQVYLTKEPPNYIGR